MWALALAAFAAPVGVFPLDGLDPDDLAPLGDLIGDARFVGLGESVHTSGGFAEAKAAVVRFLVEEEGFRALAMETPWVPAQVAADYVATCEGDPAEATQHVLGVFWDASVTSLLEWMCGWNAAHPDDPVRFFGFDVQQGRHDQRLLAEFLRDRAPGAPTEEAIAGFEACATGIGPPGTPPDPERHARCHDGLAAASSILDDLARERGEAEVTTARLHRVGLGAFEDQVERFREGDGYAGMAARDEAMADVLLGLADQQAPGARVAVWTHNLHVAMRTTEVKPRSLAWDAMGGRLLERLGSDWYPIALVGYDVQTSDDGFIAPPPPASRRDVERPLHDLGAPYALVDLERTDLFGTGWYRVGGAQPPPNGGRVVPAQQYRALLYLDASRPMKPVEALLAP